MQEIIKIAEDAARQAGASIIEAMSGLRQVDYKGNPSVIGDGQQW
jgi:hypothetical protein